MTLRLKNDMVGLLAYTLTVDGEVVETVDRANPIEYLHGAQNIVEGLEAALEGKQAGDTFEVTVAPEQGYGEYLEDDIEAVPASEFDDLDELQVGMELEMVDEDGDVVEATIVEITPDQVVLDFNPPLAGKTLHYTVEVVDVREATEEELEMGLPASLIDEMYDDVEEDEE
ncbi:peptidylprolyl isomerase [Aggregatilineales bacterium SYSU G02658]